MRAVAARLLWAASELVSDLIVVVDSEDSSKRNIIEKNVSEFISRVRVVESLESFLCRRDNLDKMILFAGFSDHEAKNAIIKEICRRAERMAGKQDIPIWTKNLHERELGKFEEMRVK